MFKADGVKGEDNISATEQCVGFIVAVVAELAFLAFKSMIY